MSAKNDLGEIAPSTHDLPGHWRLPRPLKRKFDSLLPSARPIACEYPSPPMSNPPSPPRQPAELSSSGPNVTWTAPSTATATTGAPNSTSTAPIAPAYTFTQPFYPPQTAYPAPFPTQTHTWPGPPPPFASAGAQPAPTGNASASTTPVVAGPSTSRPTRRSKTHVASACINCKRAHLSCDVQRPCTRCVGAGKQDSCVDVVHKKRGRPRLRDDSESQPGQNVLGTVMSAEAQIAAGLLTPREYARARHRRGDSLRSLRSQNSSEQSPQSSLPTPSLPPPGPILYSYAMPPPPPSDLPPADVPTAFLDLDLVFIRANNPFRDIIALGRDVAGMRLSDLVTAVDSDGLEHIGSAARAEREAREPAYMAPMRLPGQDPLQGVTEADIDRLTHSFMERSYTWRRSSPGSPSETFPARVRLGKANTYFLVVTLPTFRPMTSPAPVPPPHTFGSNDPRYAGPGPSTISPTSQYLSQYAGPSSRPYLAPTTQSAYSTYPGPSPSQRSPPPATPLSAFQPPRGPTPFTPRTMATEPERRLQSPVQLPPLLAAAPGPSTSQAPQGSVSAQRPSGSDEEEDGEPRKRRRVGISDVLQ